jgi:hypothetical protein
MTPANYTFEGKPLEETTAWKGSATSPASTKLPRGGGFTLFGPCGCSVEIAPGRLG